jgi:hypothetical protein
MKIALAAKYIALPDTLAFINQQLFVDEHRVDNLILDVFHREQISSKEAAKLLNIIKQQFS